jgi:hypothetical protein
MRDASAVLQSPSGRSHAAAIASAAAAARMPIRLISVSLCLGGSHQPQTSPGPVGNLTFPAAVACKLMGAMQGQRIRLTLAASALLWAAGLLAQQPAPPAATRIDVSKLGPQVGERVPDFNLRDQNGRPRTLQSIIGPRGAMLVFVRSADW